MADMDWRRFFSTKILTRGRDYYRRGCVKDLKAVGDIWTARVIGSHIYKVRIAHPDARFPEITCTCPYAEDGNYCKHEAAVFYEMMAEQQRTPGEKMIPYRDPFAVEGGQELYFDVPAMVKRAEISSGKISEAQDLIDDGKVKLVNVSLYYDHNNGDQSNLAAFVQGTYQSRKGLGAESVTLHVQRDKLSSAYCDHDYLQYSDFYMHHVCAHIVALLILFYNYVKKYNPGDETTEDAYNFLEAFGARRKSDDGTVVKKQKTVMLKPRLLHNEGERNLRLGFRIGNAKLFVLKNLSELVEAYESGKALKLGKNDLVNFSLEDFTDEAAKWYSFIVSEVRNVENVNDQLSEQASAMSYYYASVNRLKLKNDILLAGDKLEKFFALSEGTKIDAKAPLGADILSSQFLIDEGRLRISLQVSAFEKNRKFAGVTLRASLPVAFHGNEGIYVLREGHLSRLSQDNADALKPFLKSGSEMLSLRFGKSRLQEFFYRILPMLEENPYVDIVLKDEERLRKQLPPESVFRFYLDADQDMLLCRSEIQYGDEKLPLRALKESDFPLAAYRDPGREKEVLDAVTQLFPDYHPDAEIYACEKSEEAVFNILGDGMTKLMKLGEVNGTDAFRRLKIRKVPALSIGVSVESDLMNLEISAQELSPEELLDLLDSFRKKKRFHRLRNGDFIDLRDAEAEDSSLEGLSAMFESMHVSLKEFVKGKMHLPLYRALYLDKMLEEHDEIIAARDKTFRTLIKNFKTVKDSDYELPKDLQGTMRNYQVTGFKWLKTLEQAGFGGILADDMGLGKTLQMIAVLLSSKQDGRTSLVVCPASLVYNWQEEVIRFAPTLRVTTITGTKKEREAILMDMEHYDVLITSYDLLKRDASGYEDRSFYYEILDEAQYVKNPQAVASKAVKVLKSQHRIALTGTPIENRLSELWSIFDFLMPGYLYEYETFRNNFETPITKNQDEDKTAQLRRMVSPFILRRLKGDVLKDLPEKTEEVRYARFEKEQQTIYDAEVVRMKQMLGELGNSMERVNQGQQRLKILAELTRIREICCDPSLLYDDYHGGSAKLEAFLELMESTIDGGHKMLVFSQFTSMLAILEKKLKERGVPYFLITGETPKQERLRLVHQFNEDDTPVFLISLKAGGTGLNLTGADVVIHYDPWWNLAAQNQATDRAHRIGQKKPVSVYRLIMKNTIEDKILLMQNQKKDLADAILSGQTESLSQLSPEELLQLLS